MKKTIVITGATGTLGSQLLNYHIKNNDHVYALSRCDHKIASWSKKFPEANWCLGDIRNDLNYVLPSNAHTVYHCAASKHVDMGEAYPKQYHDVNYQGTLNVFHHINCERFAFFSTDKAVLPTNFYGMTKALAEKHLITIKKKTYRNIQIFRWGNIIGSQGSVIHHFINQLLHDKKIVVTHPDMTRFWLKIEDAVQFSTREDHSRTEEVLIHPNIKAARVLDLADVVAEILGVKDYKIEYSGIRPGEKIHEHLKSDHDSCVRSDTADKYSRDELFGLVGSIVNSYI